MSQLKPQDLRIGNYVKVEQDVYEELSNEPPTLNCYFTVQELTYNSIYIYNGEENVGHFDDGIIGIPITEEILLMAGFNKDYKKGYIGIDAANSDFVLTEPFKMGEWQNHYCFQFETGNVPKFKQLEFLHELQNIFATFYNEELQINLK